MKQVIVTYGKFLISGVVLIAIFLVLSNVKDDVGNKGALHILGARIHTEDMKYDTYTDFDVVITEANIEKPIISYIGGENVLHVGTVSLADIIKATDADGNMLSINVLTILNPVNEEVAFDENKVINCTMPGIYTVTVSAVDMHNKKTVREIKFPINY